MTSKNTKLQEEIDELNKEYEDMISEINEEYESALAEAQSEMSVIPGISDTQMHAFNIAIAAIMIIIGAILAYQTRNNILKNGKKIAGWILLILGILTLITHVIQLIF